MSDELLTYYNRELEYLRKSGAEFAKANPKIAGRLRMADGKSEDPHVSRLIESFAYLNARTRRKIEDDFPEISLSMLQVLYPHYLVPIPSSSIVQFKLDPSHEELIEGFSIAKGSGVETEPINGEPCRFRTCYPVTLWPLNLKNAGFHPHPFPAPQTRFTTDARSLIQIELESFGGKLPLAELELDSLRFYLNVHSQFVYQLYELILNNTLGIALTTGSDNDEPVLLSRDHIHPVGFESDQGLVEYSARSFLGYRLLSEYFSFPQKFLFFDLEGLDGGTRKRLGDSRKLVINIFVDQESRELERNVNENTFLMGCTPMVNLFRQRAEPIRLTQTQTEYRVVPDARRPLAHEIYSIDRVVATSSDSEQFEFSPFYSIKHHGFNNGETQSRFWHSSRRPAGYTDGQLDHGTEVYLAFVDLEMQPSVPADWTIDVETTCLNRDLPGKLPFGGGQPLLQLSEGALMAKAECVTAPTETLRPNLGHGSVWRLISHLSLNHLSLIDTRDGADALREILSLYDVVDRQDTRRMISGLERVSHRRVTGRSTGSVAGGFCRGLEVTLHFDEDQFTGSGVFLFASVLERFLGLYSSINSFTKTVATTNKRDGVLRRWPPRAGEQVLL